MHVSALEEEIFFYKTTTCQAHARFCSSKASTSPSSYHLVYTSSIQPYLRNNKIHAKYMQPPAIANKVLTLMHKKNQVKSRFSCSA